MAYNLKYYNEFKNYYNETIRIEILGLNFTGDSTEIITMATPLIISYPGDDNNVFNPIIGSQATINILSQTNFQFIDLHNSDARAHRVDIYKDLVLKWIGWIIPDLFSEPYVAPPYPVSITARCGIGEWKEKDMPAVLNRLNRGAVALLSTDIVDLYSIIANYIGEIDTSLILNEAISVYSSTSDTINSSPLADTYIYLKAYEGMTVYEAISDILITFGARIYQMDGQWWIVRLKEMNNTLALRQWTISLTGNNTFTTDETQLKTFKIGRPESNFIVNEGPQLDINPAWKKFTWIQDLYKKDSIIRNGDFSKWNIPLNRRELEDPRSGTIEDWMEWKIGTISRKVDSSGNVYAQFEERYIDYTGTVISGYDVDILYIFQNAAPIEISVNQDVKVIIEYDILVYDIAQELDSFVIELKTIGSTSKKYLQYDDDTGIYSWTDTPTYIVINNIDTTYYGSVRTQRYINKSFNWRTLEFIAPGFENPTSGGAFEIRIHGGTSGYLRLKNCRIVMIDSDDIEYEDEIITNIIINENNIYVQDEIEVVSGDLPDITNAEIIWDGGYRDANYAATELWHERGSALEYKLLELIGKDYENIFLKPQFKLSIPILSQSVKFDSCIVDYLILSKKYICAGAEIDMQTCIFSGVYMEFNVWEDADWILDDGTWNDDNIWVDTDEFWNEIIITNSGDNDITQYFSVGDTITSLPVNTPGVGGTLKEDDVTISVVPHVITGTLIEFRVNPFVIVSTECTFTATISGEARTFKIVVNL